MVTHNTIGSYSNPFRNELYSPSAGLVARARTRRGGTRDGGV